MIKDTLHAAVKEALIELGAPEAAFTIERPGELSHGDYATNAALSAAKMLKENPRALAERLAGFVKKNLTGIEKVEVAGAGFVNFFLSREALATEMFKAAQDERWGDNDAYAGKTVMVEYTDPNPFKEFHIGHLMSNAVGESVARLIERSGAKVLRANYQGDVGPHVAKALWGKMQKPALSWGAAYVYGNEQYEAYKNEIDAVNKKVYDRSDQKINEMYDAGRTESLEHFEKLYAQLGTKFDYYFFESKTAPLGLALVKAHPEVFEESEGAVVFRGSHTRVFVTSLGLPTYETKDLGLLELKKETAPFDESITVTANEQNDYIKVVLEAARILPEVAAVAKKTKHLSHGMMKLLGGKMSSRLGNVITGEALLEDLTQDSRAKMHERKIPDAEKIAGQVAVGALKYAVLKSGSGRDIVFEPEASLSLEGDSGPYLQYARVRAASLIAAAQKAGINPDATDAPAEPTQLERIIAHYPEVLARAAAEFEPHYLTTYLTELAAAFNAWYGGTRVIGGPYPSYGLLLAQAAEATLHRGLWALGIPAPEEM